MLLRIIQQTDNVDEQQATILLTRLDKLSYSQLDSASDLFHALGV